jgi:phenylalanyl-tRNA synthetase beta chain
MIISVNWLKKFTDITLPVDELATLIGARLVEIEEVIDLGEKYKDVVIARVVHCEDVEGSDHLHRCLLDDGGATLDVERDNNGYVQVVCGASNVREGLLVAWLPPKSTVPSTFGTDEPFVLDARKLRGVMSSGMIASAKELDLFDDHTGILEIDAGVEPGASFAETYELNDHLLDIENKSLTHRPDCFGIIGFAREVAGIQGRAFVTPDWLRELDAHLEAATGDTPLSVTINDPELSDRYQAIILKNVNAAAQSPLWMQTYLARVGVRPINAVVDITNYLMMLTGQPTHAFDYDKVVAKTGSMSISVRAGRRDEKLLLLDGRSIALTPDDIVIAAGDTAIALAGAMGGAETEIDENTKTVILESATFNLYNLRATQMRHGIFSEAITRFTKGQPAALTTPVLGEAVRLLAKHTSAVIASGIHEAYPGKPTIETIPVTPQFITTILGGTFTAGSVADTLRHVEFTVDEKVNADDTLAVIPPYWRSDIHIPEDIVEEIGRLGGYDTITPTLPKRDFVAVEPSEFDQLRGRLRVLLMRAGVNETLTYNFVHGDLLKKAGQSPENSYRLVNSISPDLQYYRQALTPSLLHHVHANIKQGFDDFAIAELNKVHPKNHGLDDEGVPAEIDALALVVASKKANGAAYYRAKRILDFLAERLRLEFAYEPMKGDSGDPVAAPFQPLRSALVTEKKLGVFIGVIGEYKKPVSRAFKLPEYCAGFEVDLREVAKAVASAENTYAPLSRYPSVERDICFHVARDISYQQVADAAAGSLAQTTLQTIISPLDIYQAPGSDAKNITLRITLTSHKKTLAGDEVKTVMDDLADAVTVATGASVV